MNMTTIIIIVFFAVSIGIGVFASRKKGKENYLIANRSLNTFQSVMTLSGTFVGAMTLLVYTAFVFTFGVSALWVFIGYLAGFILFARFGVWLRKNSKNKKYYTIADFFKEKQGTYAAKAIISVLFLWYFGTLSAQFIGGGKILESLTGLNFQLSAIIMCTVILTYLLLGGFQSVVRTDIFQFLTLLCILIVMALTLNTGLAIPLSHLNPFNAGIVNIMAFLLLGILTPFATQDYWQRVFAMKSNKVVRQSFHISGVLMILVGIILTYVGLVAKTVYSNIDPDLAVLHSFTQLAPPILTGFIAAAFFAAILSTADTFLFVLAINFVRDLLGIRRHELKAIKLSLVGIGVAALILALVLPNLVDITLIFKALGLLVSPIILAIWLGKEHKKATIITTIVTATIITGISIYGFIDPALAIISTGISTITYFITRKLSAKPLPSKY